MIVHYQYVTLERLFGSPSDGRPSEDQLQIRLLRDELTRLLVP